MGTTVSTDGLPRALFNQVLKTLQEPPPLQATCPNALLFSKSCFYLLSLYIESESPLVQFMIAGSCFPFTHLCKKPGHLSMLKTRT